MRQTKPTTLYAAPLSKAYWRDAAAELRDTRMLVFAALMIALRVALKSLGIPIAADLKINIAFFVNAFGAMIFGPVVAIIAAAISDTLGCTLIFALFLYRARVTATRVILSRFCIDFFVNIVLNTPIMWLYYKMVLGKSYTLFQLPRIIKNLALFPLESVLLTLFLAAMMPVAFRFGLLYDKGESLRMQKRQVALLSALFVLGAACVGGYFVYDYNTKNHASSLSAGEIYELNAALSQNAQSQSLLDDGQVVTVSKVYKKLKGDTTVEFTVYQSSEGTDAAAVAGYLDKNAKKDESLTLVASGTAVLIQDSAQNVTGLTVTAAE